ncbi:ROK family protein [candidate division KSB1 bacterium]|nr:ROK family protein [candidate division KSB1 bacterium]
MNQKKRIFIGLDLGGSFIKYALGDHHGDLLYTGKKPSRADQSQDVIFSVIYEIVDHLREKQKELDGEIAAIGFGSPGSVDFDRGRLIGATPNINEWTDADIRGRLQSRYNLPTWVDNDANVMAYAEARVGAGRGMKNIIALTLGTGIGGGILIDGKIYRGSTYAGAEIGHMSINFAGPPCNCGNYGCIEQYASAPAMLRFYEANLKAAGKSIPKDLSTFLLFERSDQGEPEAQKAIQETCRYLGYALANLANIFNPDAIIIGGGVADADDSLMEMIAQEMKKRALPPAVRNLQVKRAELGNRAGMVGAILLAADCLDAER